MTEYNITPHLKQFLTEWLAWVDNGAVEQDPFERGVGLCGSLDRWVRRVFPDNNDLQQEVYDELQELLFGDYPFGGKELYSREAMHNEMHTNELRLAWVRRMIGEP